VKYCEVLKYYIFIREYSVTDYFKSQKIERNIKFDLGYDLEIKVSIKARSRFCITAQNIGH